MSRLTDHEIVGARALSPVGRVRCRGRIGIIGSGVLLVMAWPAAAQVHQSQASGQWYPEEPGKLVALLDGYFETAETRADGVPVRPGIRAVVAPHAAFQYSGYVAAAAYRLIGKPKNVILLGFSHRDLVEGIVAPDLDAYSTPLGELRVNREAVATLGFPRLEGDPIADHSLENQLPFLQRVAPDASLIPLYVGDLDSGNLAAAARKLAARVRQGDVLIASSDFTHYGKRYDYAPFPDDGDTKSRLRKLAMTAVEAIGSIDAGLFEKHLLDTGDTICGRNPIRLLMATLAELEDDIYLNMADYMTSGDLTRDHSSSVGYGALAFYPASAYRVTEAAQRKLLASARSTLDHYLEEGSKVGLTVPEERRNREMEQRSGVFVTVKKNGRIRGCVGAISPRQPLWGLVADRTLAAAEDRRFQPLSADEAPVTLEISVLTPVKRIAHWSDYRLGYGAALVKDGSSGILLPQVAAEQGWNEEQFLENLARKAGLPADAYKDPEARLYVYGVQVFGEPAEAPARADEDH